MKRVLLIAFGLLIIGLGSTYVLKQRHVATAPSVLTPIPTSKAQATTIPTATIAPTLSLDSYCTSDDIEAIVALNPAAGNIYGTLNLKNISSKACNIIGSNYIQATSYAQNIAISQQGKPGDQTIELSPNESVYSEVHFPNGPQCNGSTQPDHVVFAYQISPQQSVTFVDQKGEVQQPITLCAAADQKTAIQVWSLSEKQLP